MTNKEPIKNSVFRTQSQKQLILNIEIFLHSKSKTSRKQTQKLELSKMVEFEVMSVTTLSNKAHVVNFQSDNFKMLIAESICW